MGIAQTERICIIGAGPAGLAAAYRLNVEGYKHVTVLEKASDLGGLCITREFEGRAFDLGANYVTSAYKRIRKMAKEVGATMYVETDASFFDTRTDQYRSMFRVAKGETSLPRFAWDNIRYLWKRWRLNSALPATGYGQINEHPELLCTFQEWLDREELSDLADMFKVPITLMGYGTLDEVPAPYALTYMRVRTVIDLMMFSTLPGWLHRWPRRFNNGFQRFWQRIAEPLDVRTDVKIVSVKRSTDNVVVEADFPYRAGDRTEHRRETLEFDWLVLSCPLQTEVTSEFLDASQLEQQLFKQITLNPLCVTTFVMKDFDTNPLRTRLVNVTPIPERDKSEPTIITQQFKDNPLVTFYTPVVDPTKGVRDEVLDGVRSLAAKVGAGLNETPETWDNFPYFPQVSLEDFHNGWYQTLESLQGHNRTFYSGGVMAFELVETVVEYSDALIERFFTGSGSIDVNDTTDERYPPISNPLTRKGLEAGFTDLLQESDRELEVEGEIPAWMTGGFVRNGTARWIVGEQRLNHWFDGMAMLHRFSIDAGRVHYRNRYLRSKNYKGTLLHGRNMYAQFATDPKRSFLNRLSVFFDFYLQIGNNDFITVSELGSEWISVGETPTQVSIDIDSLATKGVFHFKDWLLAMWTCSHMLTDTKNNRVYNYSILALPFFSRYRLWYVDADTHRRTHFASIKDRRPSYMHSFGLSENHLVLTKFPLKLNPLKLLVSGFTGTPILNCMDWNDNIPTETVVIDKETGRVVNTVDLPSMFGLHYLNAWEEDGEMVFDIATYEDASPLYHLLFANLLSARGGQVPYSGVMRYRIPLDGTPPSREPERICDAAIEMPRINDNLGSSPYRYAYGQSWDRPGYFYDRLVKIDTHGADPATNYVLWGEEGLLPSEPVFVRRPGATEEDDGAVVSVVLDVTGDEPVSFLVVLDGQTFTELARARVPHVIPFGLHGAFVRNGAR
jgi:carotenoid cleavage dioxygenase-like enzyme